MDRQRLVFLLEHNQELQTTTALFPDGRVVGLLTLDSLPDLFRQSNLVVAYPIRAVTHWDGATSVHNVRLSSAEELFDDYVKLRSYVPAKLKPLPIGEIASVIHYP